MQTINELSQRTGLSVPYIRKCKNKLGEIIAPYISRGGKNKLLFDDKGIAVFKKIKKLKDEGLAIVDIEKKLKLELKETYVSIQTEGLNTDQTGYDEEKLVPHPNTILGLLNKMIVGRIFSLENDKRKLEAEKEGALRNLKESEVTIKELEKTNQELNSILKKLPQGKSAEEIRKDWEVRQQLKKEKVKLLVELKNTGLFSFWKRRKIIRDLMEFI